MINNAVNRITYLGDGIAKEFAVTFNFLEKADLVVVTIDPDNNETILTKDYFVDLDKKTVTYPGYSPGEEPPETERPPILPAGWKLVIYRDINITQESSLGDKWPFSVIEDGLDKLTMICQDIFFASKRMLKLPESAGDDVDTSLPTPTANASIYWDETGKKLISGANPNLAAADASASAGRALESETNAKESETKAKASENAAKASEEASASSESNAATSERNAATSETNAATSAAAALDSERAASLSESHAATSEANAKASENAAKASETASATSQRYALDSASAAAKSEAAALASQQAAEESETNAATSETNAANSAKAADDAAQRIGNPVASVTEEQGKVTVTKTDGTTNTFNAGLNILARNKAYAVGDIAYSPNLPSYMYLECVQAGTTANTEPDFSTVKSGGQE